MVQRVLNMATEDSDNPDLRDRGYVYWRLLSSDPEGGSRGGTGEKPEIRDDTFTLDSSLLEDLMSGSTLSSIYHKPPEAFVMKTLAQTSVEEDDYDDDLLGGVNTDDVLGGGGSASAGGGGSGGGDLLDLMDDGPVASAPAPAD